MKSMTIKTLSGKAYHIENNGRLFLVLDKDFIEKSLILYWDYDLINCVNYVTALAR